MSTPRLIHIASRCYVKNFAVDSSVEVLNTSTGKTELRNPQSVARRDRWWGKDRELSRRVEDVLQKCETASAPILQKFVGRWPLNRDDRATIAQFAAIHTVRGPAWQDSFVRVSAHAIKDVLAHERWEPAIERGAIELLLGDRMRVEALLKQIPRMASLLACMHWSLIALDEPLLASSDQPVVVVPFLAHRQPAPIEALPRAGFLDTVEVRIPIDPQHLLLLSWLDEPDGGDVRRGSFPHAADVNRSTFAQADVEWFYKPGTHPPRLAPPFLEPACEPISYGLLPGYSLNAAYRSRRRTEADRIMRDIIASGVTDTLTWVSVRERTSAA